jgi:acetamidase/formamidase
MMSFVATHRLECTDATTHVGFFDNSLPAVLTIDSGDTVDFEVGTVFGNRIKPGMSRQEMNAIRAEIGIPHGMASHTMTGPVAVRQAEVGDVLEVRIHKLVLGDFGLNSIPDGSTGAGFLPEDFVQGRVTYFIYPEQRDAIDFAPGIRVPLRPFLGVMGVAPPAPGMLSSMEPREFGGNMDNKELVEGTIAYFPVWVKDALFSTGDAHATQGNGEVSGTAMETSMRSAALEFHVRKDMHLARPMAETPTHWITMAFDPDLDVAAKTALRDMICFLGTRWGLCPHDAYSLSSLAVDLEVTQVVDGNRGIHAMLPKSLFTS